MIQTIRVKTNIGHDIKGENVYNDIKTILKISSIEKVETATVYRIEGINKKQADVLAQKLLSENINQTYSINKSLTNGNSHVFEIGYKKGVMNPQVASILKAAKDLNINCIAADSSCEYELYGNISKEKTEEIIKKLNLFNPTVEQIIKEKPKTLLIKGKPGVTIEIPLRKMSDSKLLSISKDKLFLNLTEMKIIQAYFQQIQRDPTDCELETIAQTWSEHCAHKTFKAKIKVEGKNKEPLILRIKKEALKHKKNIVSAFVDNSGVMDFYDGFGICGKVETHNAPSAIEPYGGAMTGSGGVFRDILGTGLGAKTIASTDIFCFANPNLKESELPQGCLPPKYLLKRVVAGVRDYGNRMGIPTNNGSVHFHNDFRAKPSIIVGAYGIIPKKQAQKGVPKTDDLIVIVGGKTGRDGVHGATFSSGEMTHETINVNSSAVQIGNAIEEKRVFDALIEARDKNCIRAIQDLGAGGFSSAIGEMGENLGVTVDLSKAPLKYQGLSPWEIWVSESQERMALAIPKRKIKKFAQICEKYNVEMTILGKFDKDQKLKIFYEKKSVCNLDMNFLHHGLPQRTMTAVKPAIKQYSNKTIGTNLLQTSNVWIEILKKVLSHGNICSKEPIVRLYDHTVQGTNVLQPFGGENLDAPNNASVIKPILNKPYGMILAHGLNPVLNSIDPYWGSIWAATEAISNYVAVGGDYKNASLINNYIWPFPDEESLWSLDQSVDAVVDFMKALKIPVISGKDSLSSTYRGKDGKVIKIPPVLCMSVFGKIPNVAKTISSDFKKEGSVICLVGKQDLQGMAGSTYFSVCHPELVSGSSVPRIDLKLLPIILDSIHQGIKSGNILSCQDISEGGLITAIFEMCLGGNMGASLNLNTSDSGSPDFFLFNETAGCFIADLKSEEIAKKLFSNIPFKILGKTVKEKNIAVLQKNNKLFSANLDDLKNAWQEPMKRIFS